MKLLLSSIFCSIIITSCQSDDKKIQPTETVAKPKAASKEEIEKFKNLYTELKRFKDEAEFKKVGFGGKYNKWLLDVQKLKIKNPKSKLLLEKEVGFGRLEQLGLYYESSKGEETSATRSLNNVIWGWFNYIDN